MALAPGDRIRMIQEIGASLMTDDVVDIDLTLGTFGAPEGEFGGSHYNETQKYEYVLERLTSAQDASVTGLHAHLHDGTPTPDEPTVDPPVEGEPLIFISHTWKNKALAAEITATFGELGIKGFVAHEDIEPTKDWAAEIERNLHACSALVAVLTEDFPTSAFCNQEIGYALGRGRLVVAVMQDRKPPPGLAGKYQAIPGGGDWRPGRQIALNVLDVLLEQQMTRPLVMRALALRYAKSHSFDDARANWARLQKIAAYQWTEEMIEIVETNGRENGQLREGYASDHQTGTGRPIPELVKEHLDRLLDRKAEAEPVDSNTVPVAGSEDDIPF